VISSSLLSFLISHVEWFLIFIPFLYGIFGAINFELIEKYKILYKLRIFIVPLIVGGLLGGLLSYIGIYHLKLSELIFNQESKNAYMMHFYAIPSYALIFIFIVSPLQQYLIN